MRTNESKARTHGAAACHMKVTRTDGRVEHRTSFNRPRPFWSLTGWRWLACRYLEYRRWEKTDGR
jgi:hypothetical protein